MVPPVMLLGVVGPNARAENEASLPSCKGSHIEIIVLSRRTDGHRPARNGHRAVAGNLIARSSLPCMSSRATIKVPSTTRLPPLTAKAARQSSTLVVVPDASGQLVVVVVPSCRARLNPLGLDRPENVERHAAAAQRQILGVRDGPPVWTITWFTLTFLW